MGFFKITIFDVIASFFWSTFFVVAEKIFSQGDENYRFLAIFGDFGGSGKRPPRDRKKKTPFRVPPSPWEGPRIYVVGTTSNMLVSMSKLFMGGRVPINNGDHDHRGG